MQGNSVLRKIICSAVVFIFSSVCFSKDVQPENITKDEKFLCDTTHEYVQSQLELAAPYSSNILPSVILWKEKMAEVVSIAHPSNCGNLGCSAIISFKNTGGCTSKKVIAVQPHMPIGFELNEIRISNITGCNSWLNIGGAISKNKCE